MDWTKQGHSIALIILLGVLAAYTYELRFHAGARPAAPSFDRVPREARGFTCTEEERDTEELRSLRADATLFRTYRNAGGQRAWLFLGYFGAQREDSQIHSPKHCYPGAGWNILQERSALLNVRGEPIRAKQLVISNGAERHLVLYWFMSRDGTITNEFALKWNQMKNSLLRRSQATTFVRFSMPTSGAASEGKVREDLVGLAAALVPSIEDVVSRPGAAATSVGSSGGDDRR